MLADTYIEHGKFELIEKPKPVLLDERCRRRDRLCCCRERRKK